MTPQQRAMASKPSMAELRRSAQAMQPPEKLTKHRQLDVAGWTVRVFDSPYCAGWLLVCADRPRGSVDGDAAVSLSEEVRDDAAADAWIARLTPTTGAPR